jgi:hypothetical protein
MEVMNAQIGDNNAIVAAHDDVLKTARSLQKPDAGKWPLSWLRQVLWKAFRLNH